ncbi:hypothetical protein Bca101_058997 [Brassica carinata]
MVVTEECLERFPYTLHLTGKWNPITRREGAVATSRGSRFCFLDATTTVLLLFWKVFFSLLKSGEGTWNHDECIFGVELEKQSYCDVKVSSKTKNYVAFKVKTTSPKKYFVRPNTCVIQPWDSCIIRGQLGMVLF